MYVRGHTPYVQPLRRCIRSLAEDPCVFAVQRNNPSQGHGSKVGKDRDCPEETRYTQKLACPIGISVKQRREGAARIVVSSSMK